VHALQLTVQLQTCLVVTPGVVAVGRVGCHNGWMQVADVRAAKIPTRRDPRRPGEVLSMGFGFVEFVTEEGAKKAMKR